MSILKGLWAMSSGYLAGLRQAVDEGMAWHRAAIKDPVKLPAKPTRTQHIVNLRANYFMTEERIERLRREILVLERKQENRLTMLRGLERKR